MPSNKLWAGLLSQLLIHQETACPHSIRLAIRLLDQLSEFDDLDKEFLGLCERAGRRLEKELEAGNACVS